MALVALTLRLGSMGAEPVLAAPAGRTAECVGAAPADVAEVRAAAERAMAARYPAVFASAEVRRVVGNWALVVVTPRIPADRAALVLYRTPGAGWQVVAGPGTAFSPGTLPAGVPPALFEPDPACG